ncbi:MAG: YihY/virulence factor BrkB family protein [Saprospiraceae bacterium]
MFLKFKNTPKVLKKAFNNWWSRNPSKESSVIAYNAIFSLPGLLVVIVTVAGYFFGADIVNHRLHASIAKAMGEDTAVQIEQMIVFASRSRDSIWATILGIVTIIVGATGVFVQMQKSLNIIWEVKASVKKSGIWLFIRTRLFSFGLIMSIGFLLLISLVISALLAAAGDWIKLHWSESLMWLFNILNFMASLGIVTVLFAMMFKILPDAKIKWRYVWIGALVTALLFELGETLLGLYFGKASPGSGYGPAGSVILILIWTTYSSMIVFFGAEFTKAYSDIHFGNVPASEVAVKDKGRVV